MDVVVVNLRVELFPLYRKLCYRETGTKPATDPRAIQPFHFVMMSKGL